MLKKLSNYLPRQSLVILYETFIRPNSDYADIIYDNPNNIKICNKIESLQYNAALAITGAIGDSSKEKLYQELGFEYLSSSRWLRKLAVNMSPRYLYNYLSTVNESCQTRSGENFYIRVAEQNIFRTLSFRMRSRNETI